MTGEEVRKLKDEEVSLEIRRLREKLYTLRTQAVTEKVEDLSQFTKIRRDVARLLTERTARAAGGAAGGAAAGATAAGRA